MAINPRRKQRIIRRETRKANADVAPDIADLRSEKRAARRAHRVNVKSARTAARMERNALKQAIAGAKDSGLKGRYLKQVVSEFGHQMADTARIVPMERQASRAELQNTLADINDQILTKRSSAAESARSAIESRLEKIREQQRREAEQAAEKRKSRAREVKNARIVLDAKLDEVRTAAFADIAKPPEGASSTDLEKYERALLEKADAQRFLDDLARGEKSAMRRLAVEIAQSAEGVDQAEAMRIVRRNFPRRPDRQPNRIAGPIAPQYRR